MSLLQEVFPLSVDTPKQQRKVEWRARFATAVDAMKNSHGSLFTVFLHGKGVKITEPRSARNSMWLSSNSGRFPNGVLSRLPPPRFWVDAR